jgi:hypothetical protein
LIIKLRRGRRTPPCRVNLDYRAAERARDQPVRPTQLSCPPDNLQPRLPYGRPRVSGIQLVQACSLQTVGPGLPLRRLCSCGSRSKYDTSETSPASPPPPESRGGPLNHHPSSYPLLFPQARPSSGCLTERHPVTDSCPPSHYPLLINNYHNHQHQATSRCRCLDPADPVGIRPCPKIRPRTRTSTRL